MQLLHQERGVAFGIKVPAIGELPPRDENTSCDFTKSQPEVRFKQTKAGEVGAIGNRNPQPDSAKRIRREESCLYWFLLSHLATPGREQARRHDIKLAVRAAKRKHLLKHKLFIGSDRRVRMEDAHN